MIIEQIYTGCLSQGAYYIASKGEVAIIDPLREVNNYISKAEANNSKIKYIFETHFHADFVSGHLTLAKETGASIIYGPTANPSFEAIIAKDNEEFIIGDFTIKVLHTPGHTLESTTYLLKDADGKDVAIFTGDTLFLGDVGRPDLAQKSESLSVEDLAGLSFDSLRAKIMPLGDDVVVYPGHGAGSACGKNMMKETVDTLGNQKRVNYALRKDMTRNEFIKELTEGLLPPPKYFPLNVKLNKEGYEHIDSIVKKGLVALSPEAFESVANTSGALVLDVRHQMDFVKGFIPRSIFIGLNGGFAPWVGALIANIEQPLLLVVEEGLEEETITRLSRVGFDNTLGYLEGGIAAWKNSGRDLDQLESISAQTLKTRLDEKKLFVVDVRKKGEFESGHLEHAVSAPLSELNTHLKRFPKQDPFYIHCAGGYRSVIAASILKSRGLHNLMDIAGGMSEMRKTDLPISN